MYGKEHFLAKAEHALGAPVTAHAEARLERPSSALGRDGLLAAGAGALVWVERDGLDPGEATIWRAADLSDLAIEERFLDIELRAVAPDGELRFTDLKADQANALLTAAGLHVSEPLDASAVSDDSHSPASSTSGEPAVAGAEPNEPAQVLDAAAIAEAFFEAPEPDREVLDVADWMIEVDEDRDAGDSTPDDTARFGWADTAVEDVPSPAPSHPHVSSRPFLLVAMVGLVALGGVVMFMVQSSSTPSGNFERPPLPGIDKTWAPGQGLRTDRAEYRRGEPVVVQFRGYPGNDQDWITVVGASEDDDTYGEWSYLHGETDGTLRFEGLASGVYEARGYFDWPAGGFKVVDRHRFVIR